MSETFQTMTFDNLHAQRDDILALAGQYGAYDVRVFGSVARGDATPSSDVDLFVSTSLLLRQSLF